MRPVLVVYMLHIKEAMKDWQNDVGMNVSKTIKLKGEAVMLLLGLLQQGWLQLLRRRHHYILSSVL